MDQENVNKAVARANLIRKCKASGGHFPEGKEVKLAGGNRTVRNCSKCPGHVVNK